MIFKRLKKLGTKDLSFSTATKVEIMNIVALLTVAISGCYTLNYVFILQHSLVATINAGFTLAYAVTLLFNYYGAIKAAKVWFFGVLMLQLLACTNLYVTNASGFHLYFFLVPTGAFLLFELNEKREKLLLSLLAIIGFFYCENTLNIAPLIVLSEQVNHIMYQSVIFFNMVEVIFILTLFNRQIEENELMLTKQATTDALTGIANRHYFFEQGNKRLMQAQTHQRPFSLILIDIDHFKEINDSYGHFNGDICLKEVTQLINQRCRKDDIFARIGGEEFVLTLPDTTLQEAYNIAEHLRSAIFVRTINLSENQSVHCSASFGISGKVTGHEPLKALLVNADKALYQAKTQGRNRSVIFQ